MRNNDTPAEVLSVVQAAAELNLTPRAIQHRIKAGTLAAVKLGPGTAAYVITRAEVERAKTAEWSPKAVRPTAS
jgi:hypothetical protein